MRWVSLHEVGNTARKMENVGEGSKHMHSNCCTCFPISIYSVDFKLFSTLPWALLAVCMRAHYKYVTLSFYLNVS